jgi:hypothetical protein
MNTPALTSEATRGLHLFSSANDHEQSTTFTGPECRKGELPAITALTLQDLLRYPFPEQEAILAPWLTTQSLTMIHAWRGVGKTHVALNIAVAVATGGSFLRWTAPTPRSVLYIDGEMPGSALQQRLRAICAGSTINEEAQHRLRFVTPDALDGPMPDLATRHGQAHIEAVAQGVDLVILDNISTLFRSTGAENEAESWRVPQAWALQMRKQGKAILFIHHSGKGGAQRGSSKREDTLDVVIHLRTPSDYSADQGARFEIHFEKYRQGFGDEAVPVLAAMKEKPTGGVEWEWDRVRPDFSDEVMRLHAEGLAQREIAQTVGTSLSTVNRIVAKSRLRRNEPEQRQTEAGMVPAN